MVGRSGDTRALLLTWNFSFVWASQLLSQVADGVSKLALLWFVYSITGSAVKTTVIGFLQTIPPIIFTPFIGVLVDRLPKKMLLITSDLVRGLLIGVLPCLLTTETFTVEALYVLVFLYGIATAVFVPTLSASVPLLVPRAKFTAANALFQSTTSLGIVLGPAMSGLGIAAIGPREVLCLNSILYLASVVCLLPLRMREPSGKAIGKLAAGTLTDLAEGLRFALLKSRVVVWLIVIASLYTFATGAFTTLFPVYGKALLHLGPVEVGYLWSFLGVGLFTVSFVLLWLTEWNVKARVYTIAVSSLIAGTALMILTWVADLVIATLLVTIIGMGIGTLTPIAWGIMQEISPLSYLGRVMAIYTTVAMGTSMAGMLFFGWVTEAFDERASLIGIAGVLMLLAAVAAASSGSLHRRARQQSPEWGSQEGVASVRSVPAP